MTRLDWPRWLPVALLIVAAYVVYAPGLPGQFVFDDSHNIVTPLIAIQSLDLENLRDALFAGEQAYPDRGLARLSFALNYYFAGGEFDVGAFKLTNLLIHVLNGLLVYWLARALLRRYSTSARARAAGAGFSAMQAYGPLAIAAIWLLHPIQLTSVLYVVQRMTSLSALFVFSGLLIFVAGRIRLEEGRGSGLWWMCTGLVGGVGLGVLCKENAALLPLFALLVEWFFFRRGVLAPASRRRLYWFYAVLVLAPAVAMATIAVFHWDWLMGAYTNRNFTPFERVLTETRVLFFYLGLLLIPRLQSFGIYHDDTVLSTGLMEPWTTATSVVGWAVLLVLIGWGLKRRSLWSFGLLWFLAGHALESTVFPLELVHEHRNYVPSFGIVFAAVFYLVRVLNRLDLDSRLAYSIIGIMVLALVIATFGRASNWASNELLLEFTLRNHPDSARANKDNAANMAAASSDVREAYPHWQRAARLNPSEIYSLVEMAKIVAALMIALEVEPAAPAHAATSGSPLDLPLTFEPARLRRLDTMLAREILDRLSDRPLHITSIDAMRSLQVCIYANQEPCVVMLPRAVQWLEGALANPRASDFHRAMYWLTLAKLHVYEGRREEGIAAARAAAEAEPDQVHYLFELALLYLALGELDAAEETISAIDARGTRLGFRAGDVRVLRERLETARQRQ